MPASPTSWAERLGRTRYLIALPAALFVVVGFVLAWSLGPLPHSDWLLYWRSAGDPSAYERGGLGLWLLAIPKALGLGPVASALALNLPAGIAMLGIAWRADPTPGRWLALLTSAYLLLLAPFAGIVQLDLLAATFMAAGLSCLLRGVPGSHARRDGVAAVLLLAAGVSTKPQYALLAWAMVGLLVLPAWRWRRREPAAFVWLGLLLLGSVLGFAADNGLRALSGKSEALRTSSAVTLYGGLLVSSASPAEGCGYWSTTAAAAAREDVGKPLLVAVNDRLAARPAAHWRGVLRCKLPQVLRPPPFSLYWLVESPNVREHIDASPVRDVLESRYQRAIQAERRFYSTITAIVLLVCALAAGLSWRRGARVAALVPLAWVFAFWGVHMVFEIQGRYFLGLFLLGPLLASLALRRIRADTLESAASPRSLPETPP